MATSILKRIQIGLNILRHGLPGERKQKGFPLIWPSYRTGIPQWHLMDLEAYIAEGFNLNTLIYSAIMYKVRALRSAPLRAYTGDVDQPERLAANDPLAQLVARPNPQQSWMTFHGQNVVYLNVAGDVYLWMIRPRLNSLPEAMYSLRPDRVYIVPAPDKKTIVGYIYVPEGAVAWSSWTPNQRRDALNSGSAVPILPQDMARIKLPNPGDPLDGLGYGLSPLSPMAQSADVDNSVTKFLKQFFDQGAMITGLLKFDVPMDKTTIAEAREKWKEIYGGVDNWGIAVLDQGGEYQKVGLSFDEMGFEVLDDRNESRILGPLGVPGILIGTRLGLNRAINANAKELRAMCWQDTLLPENALFEDELQYFLQGKAGQFVAFDYSQVEALKKDVVSIVNAYAQLWSTGVPADVAAKTVGLQVAGEIPGGNVGYLPLNVVAVGVESGKPANTAQGAPEAQQQAQEAGAKARPSPASRAAGAMIACFVGDDWGIGSAPVEERHLTLAYIPDVAALDKGAIVEQLELFSGSHGRLSGIVNAATVFENGGERALVALIDSPQLPYWRNDLIGDTGLKNAVDEQHGYIPHVTLSYLEPGEAMPDVSDLIGREVQLPSVSLVWNPDGSRLDFSLDGLITSLPGDRKGKAHARRPAGR